MAGIYTNAGKNRLRDLFDADLHHGQLGTGATDPLATDTDLVSGIAATSTLVTTTASDKQVVADYSLPATLAVGSTITELGIFADDGTLVARMTHASLVHSSTEQWQDSVRFFMD